MSRLNINRLTNENEDGAPRISGISTFSSSAFLETPKGTTAQRPENVSPGMIRFNTDSGHLEYYNGVEWTEVLVANNTLDGGNRGLFGGGRPSPASQSNVIDYVTISTLSNAIDFGDLVSETNYSGACVSSTRGVFAGGDTINVIQFVTISSTGNTSDFGDLIAATRELSGCSSSTRGLFGGGYNPTSNIIDYVTILSTGNAIDFGDLTSSGWLSACSNAHGGL